MRIFIVEDEPVIAQRLERLLRAEAPDGRLDIDRYATFEAAQHALAEDKVDVVFLDLNLNGKDGFDLVKNAVSGAFHTVVVSAHTERAIEAFEIGVLDFVGKPFNAARIRNTLDRINGARASHPAATLAVRSAGRVDLVPVAELAYVRAAGSYAELILRNGTVHIHSKSLEKLLSILPASFERIHRSYLVRLDNIAQVRVREGSRYTAVLTTGEKLPIGRTRVEAVKRRLGNA
ncbi:MAG: LytTR family DNA-binding domain-containing protein [Bacteroidota bacterium]